MTTIETLTEEQIADLRRAAGEAGDFSQVAICAMAEDGALDPDDHPCCDPYAFERIGRMTQDEARAECVSVIRDAEANAADRAARAE